MLKVIRCCDNPKCQKKLFGESANNQKLLKKLQEFLDEVVELPEELCSDCLLEETKNLTNYDKEDEDSPGVRWAARR